ncbi:hypothetical protein PIB30_041881 [Stylosanthes scabra]|uniref:PGG domain-containing protein n=1 Tax=Stylosanthes scabra TaxID=79078 RepID=A0ABU6WH56_9FABA|nr:hypothetical protein [Stylosanthes scabra]
MSVTDPKMVAERGESSSGAKPVASRKALSRYIVTKLAERTLEGKWDKVLGMYRNFPEAHTERISNDYDNTALHVAVDLRKEQVVKDLVEAIIKFEKEKGVAGVDEEALGVKNRNGDTPLHLAASRGFIKICMCIIGENEERMHLLKLENKNGETPFFLAALNWNKHSFAYLSSLVENNVRRFDIMRLMTRGSQTDKDKGEGESILHCAINRECFVIPVRLVDVDKKMEKYNEENQRLRLWEDSKKTGFNEVRGRKQKHKWSYQLLNKLMENPYEAFTGVRGGEKPYHDPYDGADEEDAFEFNDNLLTMDLATQQDEPRASPKSSGTTVAPTHQNDHLKGSTTKSGNFVLKCCDWVMPNGKNTEEFERIKPMRPQLLMKCGCGRADCTSNIAAAIAVADHNTEDDASDDNSLKETPYLLAAKHGIIEMVLKIQQDMPSVIHSTNSKNQNVLLVAVKNRQPKVVLALLKKFIISEKEVWDNLVIGVDDDENTLLHLAAEGLKGDKSWQIAGSALQMMWDIKWYQYMKKIVPRHSHFRSNKDSKTAGQIFNTSHQGLMEEASQWMKETSESCSVVAALVAGVSFATASNVPGGYDNGEPPLEGQTAFDVFALSSLIGLCFSVTGLIMFLSILTSRKVANDFRRSLPQKLLAGLSSLFVSIVTLFVSFCSGHFFLVNHTYRRFLFPLYAATSIPVAFYAMAQLPLYIDLLRAILTSVPSTSHVGEIL